MNPKQSNYNMTPLQYTDNQLQNVVQFVAGIRVLSVVGYSRKPGHQRVLAADVQLVVNLPVHVANLPGRVVEALHHVLQDLDRAQGNAHALDGVHEGLDKMGRGLKDVGPHKVHEVDEGVFATKAEDAEGHVLDGGASGLPVNQISENKQIMMKGMVGQGSTTNYKYQ